MKNVILNAMLIVGLVSSASALAAGTSNLKSSVVTNREKTDQVGVGLQVGTSTGVNIEYWATQFRVWNVAGAQEHSNGVLTFGHNWMLRESFAGDAAALVPYIGIGALGVFGKNSDYLDRTNANPDFVLAVQVPVGLEWLPQAQRFSIFGQLSPSAEVSPILMGFVAADLGARFYF